jgi:hypothetical protein
MVQNQVEGFTKGQNVVVVEDLISTGNSSKPLKLAPSRQCERHGLYSYGFAVRKKILKMLILIFLLEQLSKFIKFSCCQTVYQ